MTAILLRTHDGRPLPVDWEHDWDRGRTIYRCCKGAFALSPPSAGRDTYEGTSDVEVLYGTVGDRFSFGYEPRPDAPEFFGIRPVGASVFDAASIDVEHPWKWIGVRRSLGSYTSCSAPDGTRRRVAAVVAVLVEHWMGLPDYAAIRHRFVVLQAPGRLSSYRLEIERMNERIRELEAERADVMLKADREAALAAELEEAVA